MKILKKESHKERRILIAMLVNDYVLARVTSKWGKEGLFRNAWSNMIGNWAVDYFKRYEKPPRADIEAVFESWAEERPADDKTVDLIDKFLSELSDEYESKEKEINPDSVLDMAQEYFSEVSVSKSNEIAQGLIDRGKVAEAIAVMQNFNKPELSSASGVDPFKDREVIKEALQVNDAKNILVKFNNGLRDFFDDIFGRDTFISFLAPEKRGKSQWLMECVYRALLCRKKVAVFSVGDMSQNQWLRRFSQRIARRPLRARTYKKPIELVINGKSIRIKNKEVVEAKGLSVQDTFNALDEFSKTKLRSNDKFLEVQTHPSSTLSVRGINSQLEAWSREGWLPDVIMIDYADILAMPDGGMEVRNQINETWKQLRAISMKYHICVITATQANAASYDEKVLTMNNFSEDKRKVAHVTAMIGINETPEEKERGIQRLNYVAKREGGFSTYKCCTVANCFDVCAAGVKSVW